MCQIFERAKRQPKTNSSSLSKITRKETLGTYPEQLEHLYNSCMIHCIGKQKPGHVDWYLKKIKKNQSLYIEASEQLDEDHKFVPWEVIAALHMMEAGGNTKKQILNGERYRSVTTRVPMGVGPFSSFISSTIAAFEHYGLEKLPVNWSVGSTLYFLESWNGFGYRARGKKSPYLWAYSNYQEAGKYVADGIFDRSAISLQVGCAILLKEMEY